MTATVRTGGCQCGAIRFRLAGEPKSSSICHCRMCQKAFGAYYAPLVDVGEAELSWTRGKLKHFRSSNHVLRGFCGDCGTPMTYEAADGIAISAGSFDDPAALPPVVQFGVEGKLGFVDHLHELPERHTMEDIAAAPFLADIISYQHPDHDTETWPPERLR
ncbi:GFA family protein [Rhizobium sp. LC145]|uniref:GFA family protein n=1 Tax=Rhizobium sp. LC145 TaxID=1120688 RepID=UPI000629FEF1|nr:GFA family protein [Rhizobium sp. LC145]KKX34415.1 aldehyde-activating protein [Rhizobium sp. LC145]TKT65449.1 GFA family protein [Rhizobiaceae bacterium LC148]